MGTEEEFIREKENYVIKKVLWMATLLILLCWLAYVTSTPSFSSTETDIMKITFEDPLAIALFVFVLILGIFAFLFTVFESLISQRRDNRKKE